MKRKKGMIGVDFKGRLGNQLFTYAFARAVMEQRQETGVPFIANFKRCGSETDSGWGDQLKHFNVVPYQVEDGDLILKYGSLWQRVLYLVYVASCKMPLIGKNDAWVSAVEKRLRRSRLHFTGAADAAYPVEQTDGRLFVRGYFQDRRFFDAIRPVLLRELTPVLPPLEHNAALYAVIRQSDTVCVSVRRGDFLSQQYKSNYYVCTPEYYRQAIQTVCRLVTNPVFVFFSDDIEWVRTHLATEGHPCYYERGDDPVWEKLRLMYSCHHFIISNSTFSWWAQYLSDRPGKRVVCPSRWFANPEWHSNLINDDFLFL